MWQQLFFYESDVPLRLSAAHCVSFARLAPCVCVTWNGVKNDCDAKF